MLLFLFSGGGSGAGAAAACAACVGSCVESCAGTCVGPFYTMDKQFFLGGPGHYPRRVITLAGVITG